MLFRDGTGGRLSREWVDVHPGLKGLLVELQEWSIAQEIPEPVITELIRTPEENMQLYTRLWRGLVEGAFASGMVQGVGDGESKRRRVAVVGLLHARKELSDLVPAILSGQPLPMEARKKLSATLNPTFLREEAEKRFSWHMARCAADLRTFHYRSTQRPRVFAWLHSKLLGKLAVGSAELLEHDVAGPHIHVAWKDEAWKRQFCSQFTGEKHG